MNKHILFDGKKSIELSQYPEEAWTYLTGQPDSGQTGIREYFKAVPWLYRGVNLRANAVASMPFAIYEIDESGEKKTETEDGKETVVEFDTSADYKNAVKFLPNPKRTFKLVEMALSLLGKAYLFNSQNDVVTLDLKYLNPTTITPILDADTAEGLVGFKRQLRTRTLTLDIEDIIYFWLEDPYVEIGEPTQSPAKAALMASGVLANVDEFVAAFFKRGAIKATIFSSQGMTSEEAKGFVDWWNKFVSGIQNAFGTRMVNAEEIKPVVIGDGIDGLSDTELTKEKREDISTALGIPQSLLWSSEAGGLGGAGVVSQDDFHFYDKTIVPECEFIQFVMNTQVFEPNGYRLKFLPETLDIFQEDEKTRAMSLGYLVNAEMPLVMSLRVLGYELTDEQWAELEEKERLSAERAENMDERFAQGSNGDGVAWQPEDPKDKPDPFQESGKGARFAPVYGANSHLGDNMVSALSQWQEKAVNHLNRGNPSKGQRFESDAIPETLGAAISGALEVAKSEDEIAQVFADLTWMGYP